MSNPLFAEVLLPFGNVTSNHPYTYSIPEHLNGKISPGDPVLVPFRSSTATGVVVSLCEDPGRSTKPIQAKNPSVNTVPHEVLEFSKWLSGRYISSWWDALRGFLMPGNGKHAAEPRPVEPPQAIRLTQEQQTAAAHIETSLALGKFQSFLLHGITGSGKTEVYLSSALKAVELGKEVLVLVPEIPLSFQVSDRFREYFGDGVIVLHSGLTEKEKRLEQAKLLQGKARIVVGPRMALHASLRKVGLIVVDEEHDASYKQENHPRYHAAVVAEKLAETQNATLLFGSATPSLETYYRAQQGGIGLLKLASRYESRSLPEVNIVDLRTADRPQSRPLSAALLEALQETVHQGQQAILFINRRGFSPVVFCRDCGYAFQCPHCSISFTYHLTRKSLRCHYCDFQSLVPDKCPSCQGSRLMSRGFGTERLEEKIRELLPAAKILRLDRDTASKRGGTKTILEKFRNGEADILLGTQMVTKGFDFPNVSLVGIICADHLLHFPDFRSGERTFQLLTQAAGRAGRGSAPGRVILQAYDPEHPVIQAAAGHDYSLFYAQEIETREKAVYPPFVSLANLLLTGEDEAEIQQQGKNLREFVLKNLPLEDERFLLGPSPCPIQKISKNFRWHLLLKSTGVNPLIDQCREVYNWYSREGSRKVKLTVDIDPLRLL